MKQIKRPMLKEVEEILNDMGTPDHEQVRVSRRMVNRYGTWLRKHDPVAFNCAVQDLQERKG